ncbi:NUDIX domain-containing protein [Methylacidiphilum caldifontis]|uniref:NUDIX hydrolase n=1 Tax=Methylacidiphilum caldifontis TaxID=2795386 RepID=A0A4Y8P9Y9_9BACT|nr:NUDIX hydrolase [Methylacidiphilum caldifontis]QSR87940.1 NUDIX hydrolase [Methylacidiphilum caldifontis]TFE67621.1 NUDIX hydrolase [Methylacidiphilum caldifontis]
MQNIGLRPSTPRYAVTTDSVVLGFNPKELKVVLIQRKNPPFQGMWALPGGFVEENEDLEEGAIRELEEETGIKLERMIQIGAFGKPGRDPRGRVISVAYLAVKPLEELKPVAGDDAKETGFFSLNKLPSLAFDHDSLIVEGCKKLLLLCDLKEEQHISFLKENSAASDLKKMLKEFLEKGV